MYTGLQHRRYLEATTQIDPPESPTTSDQLIFLKIYNPRQLRAITKKEGDQRQEHHPTLLCLGRRRQMITS